MSENSKMIISIIKSASEKIYKLEQTNRASGRTTKQIEELSNFDVFVVCNISHKNQIVKDYGLPTRQVIIAQNIDEIRHRTRGLKGKVILDHFSESNLILNDLSRALQIANLDLIARRKPPTKRKIL